VLLLVGAPVLVALWLIFLAVRVDAGAAGFAWPVVWVPFWLLSPVAWLAFAYYYTASSVWADHPVCGGALWASAIVTLLDAFTALLAAQLHLSDFAAAVPSLAMSWNWVFLPLWLGFAMAMTVDMQFPARRSTGLHSESVLGTLVANLKLGLLVFSVLVLLKLDGIISRSVPWSVVFLPLFWVPFVALLLVLDEVFRRISQQDHHHCNLSAC
jgi:hypothetical protein